jgi:hypothetical protein
MPVCIPVWITALLFICWASTGPYQLLVYGSAVGGTSSWRFSQFAHVSAFTRDDLHWLPLQQCILFRISSIVWRCVVDQVPPLRPTCPNSSLWLLLPWAAVRSARLPMVIFLSPLPVPRLGSNGLRLWVPLSGMSYLLSSALSSGTILAPSMIA